MAEVISFRTMSTLAASAMPEWRRTLPQPETSAAMPAAETSAAVSVCVGLHARFPLLSIPIERTRNCRLTNLGDEGAK